MAGMVGSVIVAGARTPMGRLLGQLKDFSAAQLGGFAIKAALERAGVAPEQVQYVIMGQVLTAGAGQIPARQAAVNAGIGMDVPALTINKVCLSGLNAIAMADQLKADLSELARPTTRRALIAKARARVVEPQRQAVRLQIAEEGAHDAGGELRPQTQPPVPVGEGVHTHDDLLARLAQEQLERLDDRRLHALIAEPFEVCAQA